MNTTVIKLSNAQLDCVFKCTKKDMRLKNYFVLDVQMLILV